MYRTLYSYDSEKKRVRDFGLELNCFWGSVSRRRRRERERICIGRLKAEEIFAGGQTRIAALVGPIRFSTKYLYFIGYFAEKQINHFY